VPRFGLFPGESAGRGIGIPMLAAALTHGHFPYWHRCILRTVG
jgi:hypothetical protein